MITTTTTTALTAPARAAIARGEPVVGRPAIWARDMALMGGLSLTTLVLLGNGLSEPAMLSTMGLTGGLAGGLLGGGLAWTLERLRGRLPLPLVYLLGTAATAAWCVVSVSVTAGWLLGPAAVLAELAELILIGGALGIGLLGWLWFAYTIAAVLRLRRWPLVALSLPWAALVWHIFRALMV